MVSPIPSGIWWTEHMVRAAGAIDAAAADRRGPGADVNGYAADRPTHAAAGAMLPCRARRSAC